MAKSNFKNHNLLNTRLDAKELATFDKWAAANELTTDRCVEDILAAGYKLSFTFVDSSNSYVTSVTGNAEHLINPSATITSWSGTLEEGVAMSVWKVYVLFGEGKWADKGNAASRG